MIDKPSLLTNHNKGEVPKLFLAGEASQTHVAAKKYKQIHQINTSFLQNMQDFQNN